MKYYNKLSTIESIQMFDIPHHIDDRGDLTVLQGNDFIPFSISRVFTVTASKNSVRGQHAHKKCSQFMVCLSGSIEVFCNDGDRQINYLLDSPHLGLMLPPGVWAQETYKKDQSILMVLCDLPYDEGDYIYSVNDLIKFNRTKD
jgi:dTDP-4-dehydrorhamnose 3,5-epimerase-like enzyme